MQEPAEGKPGTSLSQKEEEQYFRLHEMLFEFERLFDYGESSDRAVAIVGPAFLDTPLTEMLDLEVEVRSSVIHTITPRRIYDCLNGGAKTPKEAVMKERLRSLL